MRGLGCGLTVESLHDCVQVPGFNPQVHKIIQNAFHLDSFQFYHTHMHVRARTHTGTHTHIYIFFKSFSGMHVRDCLPTHVAGCAPAAMLAPSLVQPLSGRVFLSSCHLCWAKDFLCSQSIWFYLAEGKTRPGPGRSRLSQDAKWR